MKSVSVVYAFSWSILHYSGKETRVCINQGVVKIKQAYKNQILVENLVYLKNSLFEIITCKEVKHNLHYSKRRNPTNGKNLRFGSKYYKNNNDRQSFTVRLVKFEDWVRNWYWSKVWRYFRMSLRLLQPKMK